MRFFFGFLLLIFALNSCSPFQDIEYEIFSVIANPTNDEYINRNWQGVPSIDYFDKSIWVAWYSGGVGEGAGNFVVVWKSDDKGKTWDKNILAVAPSLNYRCFDPILWSFDDNLFLFVNVSNEWWDGKGGVYFIKLSSTGKLLEEFEPRFLVDGIIANKPELKGDQVHFPISKWPYGDNRGGIFDFITNKDFEELNTSNIEPISEIRSYDEPLIADCGDSLICLVRTKEGQFYSSSYDEGLSWSRLTEFLPSNTSVNTIDSRIFFRKIEGRYYFVFNNSVEAKRKNMVFAEMDESISNMNFKLLLDHREKVSYPDLSYHDSTFYCVYDRNRYEEREIYLATIRIAGNGYFLVDKKIIDSR
ncbi:sialidase family protein [Ekhidna sp.]|uniref:sialidase family protein n=1 Tax=Ekhidna sp. TaxID=2608089 RepID=UPI0035119AA9